MASVIKMPAKGIPFLKNARDQPYSNLANIKIAFDHDPGLRGTFHYDEFLDRVITAGREWADEDDTRVAAYLQARRGLLTASTRQVQSVVNHHAREHTRNCVHEYFASLIWDGRPRIASAFINLWRAVPGDRQPLAYLSAISANFFLAMVARAMVPGCQADEMVVFESSDQGLYKSSAIKAVGGDWYFVAHSQVTDKDFFQDLQGMLIVEISELSAFSRSQVERIKTVISTRSDRFRASYDRRSSDHPRRCVFAGTTNLHDWLTDETGGRRFWPVIVGTIDIDAIKAQRDQLFAEAFALWKNGAPWWEVPLSAKDVQADRKKYDEWTSDVIEHAHQRLTEGQEAVSVIDIMVNRLKIDVGDCDKSKQMRVTDILTGHKWWRDTYRPTTTSGRKGEPIKAWFPPKTDNFTV